MALLKFRCNFMSPDRPLLTVMGLLALGTAPTMANFTRKCPRLGMSLGLTGPSRVWTVGLIPLGH